MHNRTQTVEAARADAEKIRLLGGAEASAIEAVGKAEAERMRLKASAYKQYGEAAMLSLVLESLPKVRKTGSCINTYVRYTYKSFLYLMYGSPFWFFWIFSLLDSVVSQNR